MPCRFVLLLLLALPVLFAAPARGETTPAPAVKGPPYYSLPPAKLAKAKALSHDFTIIHFAYAGWSMLNLVLLLSLGVVARLRDAAVRITRRYWLQGPILFASLVGLRTCLNLPISIYAHQLAVAYGLSVQGWASWMGDVLKSLAITALVGSGLAVLLFACIRRWPRRWWLAFWTALVPIVLFGAFVVPIAIDPLFDHFEPLLQTNPQLAAQLEQVVARAGVSIPTDHMFLMRASDKYTGLNAYVTGLGASRRVVVWDTTLAKAPVDVIQIIFAHELGHYVLHHVLRGVAMALGGLLVFFFLAKHLLGWLLRRFGAVWRIPSPQDWGALPVLMLLLSVGSFLSEPIVNGISRGIEHDADVYGQEAMHSLLPDARATDIQSFQILGEAGLDDPSPSPFVEFWMYNHPSTTHRAEFAATYNPWAPGGHPRYFSK